MDLITTLPLILCCLIFTWFYVLKPKLCHRRSRKLPPGPYQFSIIGNILQLSKKPHKTFAHLSKVYGPIMSLKFGNINLVIISSPEMAKKTLVKHDHILSVRRPVPLAAQAHYHDKISVAFLPVGNRRRKLRKICKEQMFSTCRVKASQGLRRDKLCQLHDYLQKCCLSSRVVNVEEVAFITALNLMSNTLFSMDFAKFDCSGGLELKRIVQDVVVTLSAPNIADFFPVLGAIDPQGIKRKADVCVGKLLGMFEEIIDERLKKRDDSNSLEKFDMLETLLHLSQGNEYDLSYNEIKHLLLDLFLGGTDTTSNTVDWAMTELLLNPSKMSNLKNELNLAVGKGKKVEESDISKLPYLQAVIKEVFRFHPPAPFLIPHKADADIEIDGYMISRNTQVIINVWSIGRDSRVWSNPDSFEPERFLESKIDVKGQDFELIPFGSGRRICPGMPLAHQMIHLMVATLVHNFDWKAKELNTNDKFGLSLRRVLPLKAIPIKLSDA
ncbi:hypothetical protein RD792_002590 [Penstemon davidsonii]|uniref:Cytochrome P450 n=1 Tax=Penstemon davidsonii TaxID=160366 RepID=A0ABR0DRF8_9LAMI|nr:hypothetical protein RD792_002590 [Penstemon davidsonii]